MWNFSWPRERVWISLLELVAVPGARVEQRQDQQLRRSALQLAVERAGVHICHEQIVCGQTSDVKPNRRDTAGRPVGGASDLAM